MENIETEFDSLGVMGVDESDGAVCIGTRNERIDSYRSLSNMPVVISDEQIGWFDEREKRVIAHQRRIQKELRYRRRVGVGV